MKYITGEQRNQITFMPDCVEDYVSEHNPVRVIDAFVDSLDISSIGFERPIPNHTGRPSYDPRDLLKLYIYGYFNRIRSSRSLMTECSRNLEVIYLLGKLSPDFRTISDFRKNNAKAIKQVFNEFVKLCMKLNLYNKEFIAIDGSKFRAQNSKDNCYNKTILEKKISNIDEKLDKYFEDLDSVDREEDKLEEATPEEIQDAIKELKNRKKKYTSYIAELDETGELQLATTDKDCRRMHSKDGFHCSYNIQSAVDEGNHMIAAYEVTNTTDVGHLKEVSDIAKKVLKTEKINVLADKGYDSRSDILECIMNGTIPYVGMKYDKDERIFTLEYIHEDITEDIYNSTKPEDIQKCLHRGIIPKCYENESISIEVQGEGKVELSCFRLNEDGTVTCPTGETLRKTSTKGKENPQTNYACKPACRKCTNRCSDSKKHKVVSFAKDSKYVPVEMTNENNIELLKFPIGLKLPNRYRKVRKKNVVIKIKCEKEKMSRRMGLVEHPFGTVKWSHGAHYVLCRGMEKVSAEIGLSFLAYNLKRAINILGVKKIIEEIY
jgi:Transposase and inactivated derivatives